MRYISKMHYKNVIPVQTGIYTINLINKYLWIPAFPPEADQHKVDAGMTSLLFLYLFVINKIYKVQLG